MESAYDNLLDTAEKYAVKSGKFIALVDITAAKLALIASHTSDKQASEEIQSLIAFLEANRDEINKIV
jgi:hypothetical protein